MKSLGLSLKKANNCMESVQIRRFFWFVFSCIQTEYGDLLRKFPYSVHIQENTDQKNSVFGHFSRSEQIKSFSEDTWYNSIQSSGKRKHFQLVFEDIQGKLSKAPCQFTCKTNKNHHATKITTPKLNTTYPMTFKYQTYLKRLFKSLCSA